MHAAALLFFFVNACAVALALRPQQFSRASGIRVINFGVPGYGPHQMLRILEINGAKVVESNDPLTIVYSLLPSEHIVRAAGRAAWDKTGPHYEVIDRTPKYMGPFRPSTLLPRILLHSRIYSELLDQRIRHFTTDNDRQRLLAILLRARDLSVSRYHASFFVVLWEGSAYYPDDTNEKWIAQTLEQNGVPTLRLSGLIPASAELDGFRFPIDRHPTAKAYALAANGLKALLNAKLLGSLSGLDLTLRNRTPMLLSFALRFGIDPSTVQRISRPFVAAVA
jgi:hypothetical protein